MSGTRASAKSLKMAEFIPRVFGLLSVAVAGSDYFLGTSRSLKKMRW